MAACHGSVGNEDAPCKLIYLAVNNAVPQWARARHWTLALLAFKIHFGDRLHDWYGVGFVYRSVPRQAQILADEISTLLPNHPRMPSTVSYSDIPNNRTGYPRHAAARRRRRRVRIGPDGSPRLYVFFASWLTETMNLGEQLEALRTYQAIATARELPRLTPIDEGSVGPSPHALTNFLNSLRTQPLSYPIAVDQTGRVADGYRVQDQPRFVLASHWGIILWYYGRQVAFLGIDALDYGARYASAYLARHPLRYPSYQSPNGQLNGLASIYGLPATVFIDRAGHVVKTIEGQFDSQGELDGDIQTYAMDE